MQEEGQRRIYRLVIVVLLMSGLAFGGLVSAAINNSAGDLRASSAGRTLDRTTLLGPAQFLSSLVDVTVEGQYDSGGAPPTSPTLNNTIYIYYTVDGSLPGPGKKRALMPCAEDPCVPNSQHNYRGTLPTSQLRLAPVGGQLRFVVEVLQVGAPGTPIGCDPTPTNAACGTSPASFFAARLDGTMPSLDRASMLPPSNPSASFTGAVSKNNKVPVRIVVKDVVAEAPLNSQSLTISWENTNITSRFVRTNVNPHEVRFDLDPATAGNPPIEWIQGRNDFKVTAKDQAGNSVDILNSADTFILAIDNVAPDIVDHKLAPQTSVAATPPIVARGTNITVFTNITDKAGTEEGTLNKNSQQVVFVQLNTTTIGVPDSPLVNLTYQNGNMWKGKIQVPTSWPSQVLKVRARFFASDMAGNVALRSSSVDEFQIDPSLPIITDVAAKPFTLETDVPVTANITDTGSQLDQNSVWVRVTNSTPGFKAPPTPSTTVKKINNSTWEFKASKAADGKNWTRTIPAAKNGTLISYFWFAKDRAGNLGASVLRSYSVDTAPPVLRGVNPPAVRGASPYVFTLTITDAGAGVNTTSAKVFARPAGGSYVNAPLTAVGATGTFQGSLNLTTADGQKVEWYAEALDNLGTKGTNGTDAKPNNFTVDLQAPVFTLTAPATTSNETIPLSWSATDPGAGVATYTIQARVTPNGSAPSDWIDVLDNTTLTQLQFCAAGNQTYEFRGFATDKAGNVGTPGAAKRTRLNGTGCDEGVVVVVTQPSLNANADASGSRFNVVYNAAPTRSFTPKESFKIDLFFSPDGGAHWYRQGLAGMANTGTFELNAAQLPSCTKCKVRVVATGPSGATGEGTGPEFKITQGSSTVDLDGNGLADSWETKYSSALGTLDPSKDTDKDGLTNSEEAAAGTSPDNKDTDGDGFGDEIEVRTGHSPISAADTPTREEARTEEFTPLYWTVPGLFLVLAIVFFVGLARRW